MVNDVGKGPLAMNQKRKRSEVADQKKQQLKTKSTSNARVDLAALVPYDSDNSPEFIERGYYVDVPLTCVSCGIEEVWTASRQKWWYEVAKGPLYSGAKLCRRCRKEARLQKGKAHPLQDFRRWLELIRNDLEPDILAAGWRAMVGIGESRPLLLSYIRADVLMRFRWGWDHTSNRRPLMLERRESPDALFQTLIQIDWDPHHITHGGLQQRYDHFLAMARNQNTFL